MNPITKKITETDESLKKIMDELESADFQRIYTGHCTGNAAFEILKEHFNERIEALYTGMSIEI